MADDLDPFGRRKDENPLASLGWHGDETASTVEPERAPEREPEPEPVASFGTAGESTHSPPRTPPSLAEPDTSAARWRSPQGHDHAATTATTPTRGKPVGRLVRAAITLGVILAVLGGLVSVLVDEGVERAERFADEFVQPPIPVPAVPRADEDGSPTQGGRPARGVSRTSLLRPAAFRRALARLRAAGHTRLMNLRVAPDRIDATAVTKGGRLRLLQIVPGSATINVLQTTGGFAGARTMTLKGIDAGAPNRLTRSAAARLGQPTSRVNYLVLSEFAGARQWNVYFKGGQIFSADARGRITRRIS